MVGFKGLFTKKTLFGLFLGQILSLFITSTGFSSSELARREITLLFLKSGCCKRAKPEP
ncbi:putative solute carrier family 35 member SLC35F1/F2/F6 [Helianthus annuus]|uniref:Solute carrier family 35 member SLC35F1/F2/F6 n=1 Tax=Helianthus annuus TaxID=4232 RepID=A0A9K3JQP6_HELAN|nr:putative solute carrier family 35 member SLC35F1/F2/F6 [Helianthus annuus]KAJ0620136.1 putative solute carrier family 35 member SLC35F1/F2/F6 [Helianthus annuus]